MRTVTLLPLLVACSAGQGDLPSLGAVFDPAGDGFYDTPFPSDARLTPDGAPDWSTFPNPTGLDLFGTFLAHAMARQGAPQAAPIHVRFDDTIPTGLLPSHPDPVTGEPVPDAAASLDAGASVQLVDVTPGSPSFGERVPFRWEAREADGVYVSAHTLAVAPWPGYTLRPRTTYALVVTTALAHPAEAFAEALASDEGPYAGGFRLLRAALPELGLDASDLAVATVFTTGDPTAELDRVARFLDERVAAPTFSDPVSHEYDAGEAYHFFRSDYVTPNFMDGEKPYASSGGAWHFRDDGLPEVQQWEPIRLAVVTPMDLSHPPDGGWPVVLFEDGTGGSYRSWATTTSSFEPATWITAAGAVGVGIDLPLHGARGTPDTLIDLHSFNVLQPDSALHMHRQAAADVLYLLKGLTERQVVFHTPDGVEIPLNPERVVYAGHSQGGVTGALALPWMGGRAKGALLSGAGGLLAITAIERKETTDFSALITSTLQFGPDEPLTELHPVLGLIQGLVEVTDPITYGRYWLHEDGGLHGQAPTPVLLTTGLEDQYTPTRTAEALATAAWLPFVGRRLTDDAGMTLRGFDEPLPMPAYGDVLGFDGAPVTAGFSQWAGFDHFVIFQKSAARDLVRNFVVSALDGYPEIVTGEQPPVVP